MRIEEFNELVEYLSNNTPPMVTIDQKDQLWYDRGFSELRERAIRYLEGMHEKKKVTK